MFNWITRAKGVLVVEQVMCSVELQFLQQYLKLLTPRPENVDFWKTDEVK